MTLVKYRGQIVVLGKNTALKILLEKSKASFPQKGKNS